MLFLTAVAAAWIACDRDDECRPTAGDGQQITILAGIADSKPVSDVIPESKTTITAARRRGKRRPNYGLFCTQSVPAAVNVSFSATGNGASATWSADSPIYWGAPATTPHTFLAYSPYASGNSSASAVKVPALNVQTGTVNPALDLLISNNLASSGVLLLGRSGRSCFYPCALAARVRYHHQQQYRGEYDADLFYGRCGKFG